MANGNILIWPVGIDKGMIEFVRIHHQHPAFSRVIVNQAEQTTLQRKVLAEIRHHTSGSTYHIPQNLQLQGVPATEEIHGSKIWHGHTFDSFGSPSNVEPITPLDHARTDRSPVGKPQNIKEARIAEWTNQVVQSADPDIAPEAPVEPAGPSRRRVAIESDSDEDEPNHEPSRHTTVPNLNLKPTPPSFENSYSEQELAFQGETEVNQLEDMDCDDNIQPASPLHSNKPPTRFHSPSDTLQRLSPSETVNREISTPFPDEAYPEGPKESPRRPNFDPEAYGTPKRAMRGQRGARNQARGGRVNRGSPNQKKSPSKAREAAGDPWSTAAPPQGHHRGSARPGPRSARGRGRGRIHGYQNAMPSQENLIDVGEPSSTPRPVIPPGFESQLPIFPEPLPPQNGNQPAHATEQPRNQQSSESAHEISSNSQSRVSGDSHIRFSNTGADYCASYIPPRNVDALRDARLAELTAQHQARGASNRPGPQNRKAEEEKLPPFHSTMRQQGKNPGKSSIQETKAQRKDRLANAMAEAFGPVPKTPVKPSIDRNNEEVVTKATRAQIKKNPAFAKEHADLAESMLREQESKKLIQQLSPLFEMARRLSGKLLFEAQFGQVLISQTPQISDLPLHSQESWAAIFEPGKPGKPPSPSSFTRIMTTNGADIDRALEAKLPIDNTKIRVWTASPGPSSVTYEFSCHSRSNEDFLIAIDHKGQYQLHKGSVTSGMINVHIPNQIWDASFVLMGNLSWLDPPEVLTNSVKTFVDSLYVLPGREKLMMVFRQPSDHEIEIRNLVVRRVSLHRCNLPNYEELQLKITEVKSLLFKRHPQDNNLWQAYENPHDDHGKLMREGRVHYEMSLVHTGINTALVKNESLEIGELTDAETTGKSLLDSKTITLMLDLTVKMVSKLDFMGISNIGTLYRGFLQEEERRRNLGEILGTVAPPGSVLPGATTILPGGTVQQMPLRTASRVTPPTLDMPLQGVRTNTVAEIITNPDGSRYYRGLGGAKIPVPDDFPTSSDRSLAPEDSATQAGGAHMHSAPPIHPPPNSSFGGGGGAGSTINRTQFDHPSALRGSMDNRGRGFW